MLAMTNGVSDADYKPFRSRRRGSVVLWRVLRYHSRGCSDSSLPGALRIAATTFLTAALVSGCGGSVAPLQSAADTLQFPATWTVLTSVEQGGSTGCVSLANPSCPSVFRYFGVSGDLPTLYQEAKSAITAAGYEGLAEICPACDRNTDSSPCGMSASKGGVKVAVDLFRSGRDVDSLGIAEPEHAIVRVIVRPS